MLTLICYNDGGAKRSVSDVESGSKLQVQKGLTQSSKLWLNLCSFKWLNPNLNLVSNLIPDGLWILYKGLGFEQVIWARLFEQIVYFYICIFICILQIVSRLFEQIVSENWIWRILNFKIYFIPLSDGQRKKWKFENISFTLINRNVIDIPSYVLMWFLRQEILLAGSPFEIILWRKH